MKGYLYILKSLKNHSYYVGSTNNIDRRYSDHQKGFNKATRYLLPVKLVFVQKYKSVVDAKKIESKLKKFKSKVIIEQIIRDKRIKLDP